MKHNIESLDKDDKKEDVLSSTNKLNSKIEQNQSQPLDLSSAKIEKDSFREMKKSKRKKSKSEFDKAVSQKDVEENSQIRKIKRVKADPNVGLSVEQVIERINKG